MTKPYRKKIKSCFLAFLLFLSAGLTGCQKNQIILSEPVQQVSFGLNTILSITIYALDSEKAPMEIIQECFDLSKHYEDLFSRTREGSDIYRINASQGEPVEVDPATIDILELSLEYSEKTNGAFDVTIAPVRSLWNFVGDNLAPPAQEEIAQALTHVGYEMIVLDKEHNQVSKKDPQAAIDLGAIAKGYIADRLAEYLEEQGVQSAIINLGGNIYALGSAYPSGSLDEPAPFTIGIQRPFEDTNQVFGAVRVSDQTVVTSGVYEQCFTYDGKLYHHILDPATGYPVENSVEAVIIITDRSVDGDALSTSCFLLGLEEGMELIEATENTEAIFITYDNQMHFSSGIGTKVPFEERS